MNLIMLLFSALLGGNLLITQFLDISLLQNIKKINIKQLIEIPQISISNNHNSFDMVYLFLYNNLSNILIYFLLGLCTHL
jgi:hypothetical protein